MRFWKHRRGNIYRQVGFGTLQASDPSILRDKCPMIIYQGDNGSFHVRAETEFMDGRFEKVLDFNGRRDHRDKKEIES